MANAVMRMPEPSMRETPVASSAASLPELHQRGENTGTPRQRKEQAADAPRVPASVAADIGAMRGGGSALPVAARAFYEPRFGADFSQVRVHTDARAAGAAKAINAKAFTVGRDIVFGAGQYGPESRDGQRLLAHELTHVVQQDGEHVQRQPDRDDVKPPPQTATPQAPPDPETVLIEELANHLLQMPNVIDALELSKGTVKRLRTAVEKAKIADDEDLKQRLAALDKKKRGKVAAAALAQVQSVLGQRRAERLDELAGEIAARTEDRFVALAEVARDAELQEEDELKLNPKRKGKRRPQFGVIRKYILKDTIERQIDKPQTKPYVLRQDYAEPLGLAKDEALFPDLHDEDFVTELQGLSKSMRQPLKDEVNKRTLGVLAEYIQERMGTLPDTIIAEWSTEFSQLDEERVRKNIEGGLSGYFAVRMELLRLFGSPTDVPATIKAINQYFRNEMVKCEFLKDSGVKMVGPGNTLVHQHLNAALKKAEDFMKDPKRKWLDEVITSVAPLGYWATNIRENRNNPARPSEHTYGFALDINAKLNPNLAKFKRADWDFISAMVGERVFATEGAKALRNPSASTEAEMLDAMTKIRRQSGTFVATFASDSSLRARLHEIVSASAAGKGKTPAEIDALLGLARDATTGRTKDRQKAAKSLQTTLAADIFKQQAIASEPVGTTSKLRDKLVKLLAPNLRQVGKVTDAEAVIRQQIVAPVDKATADAKKHETGALFTKAIVKELNAVAAADRTELARQVLRDLREPLIRKTTEADARALAGLLQRAFQVLDQTTDKTGAKAGTGGGMPNIAVHGFSNLNEKLVVALVHPEGGNLRWLGVHNQDMHHFELRGNPPIPKATIPPPAPEASLTSTPPATAPQPEGPINP
ncbi:MAG: DUF4157 domain-containing protein [Vicinamibacterales bacterium]